MVRRHAVVLSATALLLTGCSDAPAIVSDQSDLDAAVAVWTDPWVAPTSATVAGPELGSDGQVSRVVGRRETPYDAGVRATARREVRLARATGWMTRSSACGDAVEVVLLSPGGALARLEVTPDGPGAVAAVEAVTAHHLDTGWVAPGEERPTCLQDPDAPPPEQLPTASAPLGDPDATDDEAAEWSSAEGVDDAVERANADPGLAAIGVRLTEPRLDDGVNRRQPPAAEVDVDVASLDDLAGRLAGWTLTYAACGGGGPVRATFVRDLAGVPAVLAASIADGRAEVRVTLPVAEGPSGTWLDGLSALTDSACTGTDVPRMLHSLGTPAVLPTELTPIAG